VAVIAALAVAFVVSVAVTPLMARVAVRLGVVDRPGPLKVQAAAVPYLGGVAVFIAVACVLVFARPSALIPLTLALALGLADDVAELPAGVRLTSEVGIGVAVAAVVPTRGVIGAVVTVVFVLVLCNAVNLLDGLDAVASTVVAIGAAGFAIVLGGSWTIVAAALAAALAGFLCWNRPPARIYLGDAGSYMVGTALAMLLASSFAPGNAVATGAAGLLLVAIPVADTAIALVRRMRAHRPLFAGDRGHVYDQLVDRGTPVARVSVVLGGCQLVLAVVAIIVAALPATAAIVTTAIVILLVGVPALRVFTAPTSWT
jgi:UDP-GlcNAc:undecaprenyl-phosphate GlcNAc-1-phosphate transferase